MQMEQQIKTYFSFFPRPFLISSSRFSNLLSLGLEEQSNNDLHNPYAVFLELVWG